MICKVEGQEWLHGGGLGYISTTSKEIYIRQAGSSEIQQESGDLVSSRESVDPRLWICVIPVEQAPFPVSAQGGSIVGLPNETARRGKRSSTLSSKSRLSRPEKAERHRGLYLMTVSFLAISCYGTWRLERLTNETKALTGNMRQAYVSFTNSFPQNVSRGEYETVGETGLGILIRWLQIKRRWPSSNRHKYKLSPESAWTLIESTLDPSSRMVALERHRLSSDWLTRMPKQGTNKPNRQSLVKSNMPVCVGWKPGL